MLPPPQNQFPPDSLTATSAFEAGPAEHHCSTLTRSPVQLMCPGAHCREQARLSGHATETLLKFLAASFSRRSYPGRPPWRLD
jgi:hypothetical protein